MSSLQFRFDYARSSHGSAELCRLILDVFDVDVSPLDRLGHDPDVIAFGWWKDDELVANVSLYQRRLWLLGKEQNAYGVQSVAVRPEWRGRGLFRDLMTRALNYADARVETVILGTETPELYTPFGFRKIEEAGFGGEIGRWPVQPDFRLLSLDDDRDVACLKDAFVRRAPVSLVASSLDHPALFLLKAVATPEIALFHLPDLDAVVAVEGRHGQFMVLLDIVAAKIPSLEQVVSALGYQGLHIEVRLTPDRLSWTPQTQVAFDNGTMVRGPFPPEGRAFRFSEMQI